MGYITELGERLAHMLSELSEERRRVVIAFVKDELLNAEFPAIAARIDSNLAAIARKTSVLG